MRLKIINNSETEIFSRPAGPSGRDHEGKRRHHEIRVLLKAIIMFALFAAPVLAATPEPQRDAVVQRVAAIQRADYEGDRVTLKRCYDELTAYVDDKDLGAKVRYWRGFALWRRAVNGANDKVPPGELQDDFKQAVTEFEAAIARDPGFADARSAAGATLGNLMALYATYPDLSPEFKDPARKQQSIDNALTYMNDAQASDPENPRVWWVLGPVRWYQSFQRKESAEKSSDAAIEMYQKGLEAARKRKNLVSDPLTPSWGEAECLMSLAAAKFYRPAPDLAAADEYAHSALKLVPHWHYVKDILIPAIETAKAKRG